MGYQLAIQAGRMNKKNLEAERWEESLRRNHIVSSFNIQGRGILASGRWWQKIQKIQELKHCGVQLEW